MSFLICPVNKLQLALIMKKIKYSNLDIHTYLMFPVFVSHNVLIDSANIGLIKWSENILEVFTFSQP